MNIPFCGVSKHIISQKEVEMKNKSPCVSFAKIHGEFQDPSQVLIRAALHVRTYGSFLVLMKIDFIRDRSRVYHRTGSQQTARHPLQT